MFVPLLLTGLAARLGYLRLTPSMDWIGSDPALVAFATATLLEIGAYYVPWLDNALDTVAAPAAVTAGVVTLMFIFVNQTLGEKLKGSDTFGKAEFYLAMPAGMLRFACIIIALLALLNARYYTTAEVKAMTKYQNENYGSNFFPTLASLQDDVFRRSFVGGQIERHLNFLLIKPTAPSPSRGTPVNARRKEVKW